jgi:hypothetical protein
MFALAKELVGPPQGSIGTSFLQPGKAESRNYKFCSAIAVRLVSSPVKATGAALRPIFQNWEHCEDEIGPLPRLIRRANAAHSSAAGRVLY